MIRDRLRPKDAHEQTLKTEPDALTKNELARIVFWYGTTAVVFGNLLYDWVRSAF